MIRAINQGDIQPVVSIYNHYIQNSKATFEEVPVTIEIMAERVHKVSQQGLPWLVAHDQNRLIGYAYASPWHTRSAYRYACEASVYIHPDHHQQGWGARLYGVLFDRLNSSTMHAVNAMIALPNDASVALHEKLGMQPSGVLKQVGFKFGDWIDVGYWQRLL